MFEAERIEALSELLRETSEAHAHEFADTDGSDSAWASWFAERLEGRLSEILEHELDRNRIATLLEEAEQEHLVTSPGRDWPSYYAEFFIARVM
jgi:hypothetical protein